jgi:hypothetical protein
MNFNRENAKRMSNVLRRMLSTEFDGEKVSSVSALNNVLVSAEMTLHDLGTLIENCGELGEDAFERRKYTDADMADAYARGMVDERAQGNGRTLSADYFDDNGRPRYLEIAKYCRTHPAFASLKPNEQSVVIDMPARVAQ